MRGRKYLRVLKGGRRQRRWHKPEAYGAKQRTGWERFYGWWLGAAGVGLTAGAAMAFWPDQPIPEKILAGIGSSFGSCHIGGGTNCVVDGDTLYVEGVKIRIADIDTPETHEPKCASEKALGDRATTRLRQLVNSGEVTLHSIDRDEDRYGRKLRIVMVGGESVGDTLVDEGLARRYEGGRRSWC
jgi:endonuclease YncB( thermonuclease family)